MDARRSKPEDSAANVHFRDARRVNGALAAHLPLLCIVCSTLWFYFKNQTGSLTTFPLRKA